MGKNNRSDKDKSFFEKASDSLDQRMEDMEDSVEKFEQGVKDSLDKTGDKISAGFESGVKTTKWVLRRVLILALIAGLLSAAGFFIWANYKYSEGTRSGNLIKISKKGVVFKTYEGQLKLGGIDFQNQEDGLSDTFNFSVTDKEVVQKLETLQGQAVILSYKEIMRAMPWQGDTNYFITDVKQKE